MGIEAGNGKRRAISRAIRKMNDAQLLRQGQAAKYMCSAQANHCKAPWEFFVIHLEECRKEWRKRHPTLPLVDSI
jgi:hypothetical protein